MLISASLFTNFLIQAKAANELVSVQATNHDQSTVVEIQNKKENIFEIKTIVLSVENNDNFKSFKTEKGWIGKKTSKNEITFTSELPIKPSESVKFGVKTTKPNPTLDWKALDSDGDEIGSGGKITTQGNNNSNAANSNGNNNSNTTTPEVVVGVQDNSTFKIIPDTPRVGSSLRVVGENFAPGVNLDFYINNQKIESFTSDEKGGFIISSTIPQNQSADRADFVIKDNAGHQKSMSLRIQGESIRPSEGTKLAVDIPAVVHRGDELIISGTSASSSTLTFSLMDSSGQILTTRTYKSDPSGNFAIPYRVASDATFGDYSVTVTDGKETIVKNVKLETTQKINLVPLKQKFDPGDTVIINGTAIANKEIELILKNPVGMEIFSEDRIVGQNGTVSFTYPLETSIREGTYVFSADQDHEHATVLFGVGQLPSPPLIATMDALNYKTNQTPLLNIVGPPSSTINLLVIDPADKQKFSDSFTLGVDGYRTYSFNLTGYTTGIYTAVVSRGNVQTENQFSVGLQTSTGKINLRTLQETYHPGDQILVLGDSNPNVILTLNLIDPNGTKIKSQELFTDKKGVYSSDSLRIPSNAVTGTWKIEAGSGINHILKDLKIIQSTQGVATINLDKTQYRPDQIIQISGGGVSISHTVIIQITRGTEQVDKLAIVSTGAGNYGTIWKIPVDIDPGTYTITLIDDKKTASTTFTVLLR